MSNEPHDHPEDSEELRRKSEDWRIRLNNLLYQCGEILNRPSRASYSDIRASDLERLVVALDGLLPGLPLLVLDEHHRDVGALLTELSGMHEAKLVRFNAQDYSSSWFDASQLIDPVRSSDGLRPLYLFFDDAEDLLRHESAVAEFLVYLSSLSSRMPATGSITVRPVFCVRQGLELTKKEVDADLLACFYLLPLAAPQ